MNYLIVVAHPDDEVLGVGGTIYKLTNEGNNVSICIMSNHAAARANISATLENDTNDALAKLGVYEIYSADFPNIKMNTVPHLDLVQFIEKSILESNADVVITHHPSDTNNDHLHTSMACQEAVRIYQRRSNFNKILEVWYMEVLSSTEWSINSSINKFNPNLFVEIGKDGVDKKFEALSAYKGVVRDYPHPRSYEAISGLSAYRGSQSGVNYAEAFECVFRKM